MAMVRRYLRTLGRFWSAAIAAEMEYRLNFVLATVNSLGNLVGSLFGLSLFYTNGTTLEGGVGRRPWSPGGWPSS